MFPQVSGIVPAKLVWTVKVLSDLIKEKSGKSPVEEEVTDR